MSNDDGVIAFFAGAFAIVFGGPALLGAYVPQVTEFFVELGILVDDAIVVHLGAGAGLDWPRLLVIAAIAALAVFVLFLLVRRSIRRRRDSKVRAS